MDQQVGSACDHRRHGATAARLTPDQKVGSSNLSALRVMPPWLAAKAQAAPRKKSGQAGEAKTLYRGTFCLPKFLTKTRRWATALAIWALFQSFDSACFSVWVLCGPFFAVFWGPGKPNLFCRLLVRFLSLQSITRVLGIFPNFDVALFWASVPKQAVLQKILGKFAMGAGFLVLYFWGLALRASPQTYNTKKNAAGRLR